ncbi:MAG TPA: VOC family protein [Candidatus Paceibacterota bacterium]|nr:VOC family protein [Candidatus Paceibacterota bacterium]
MIHHVMVNVSDFAKAKDYYLKTLQPLGYSIALEFPEYSIVGFGQAGFPEFIINAKGPVSQTTHVALTAPTKEAVDTFYNAAIAAGGKDNGKPGYRKEYAPGYYGAFVHDADGNNIEAVFMDPNPGA